MDEPEDIEARVRRDLAESMWRSLEADLYPEIDFSFPPDAEVDVLTVLRGRSAALRKNAEAWFAFVAAETGWSFERAAPRRDTRGRGEQMTVAELIGRLREMEQSATVYVDDGYEIEPLVVARQEWGNPKEPTRVIVSADEDSAE